MTPCPFISRADRFTAGCNAAVASRSAAAAAATMINISHVVSPTSHEPKLGTREPLEDEPARLEVVPLW